MEAVPHRSRSLDALRGIAISLVLVWHYGNRWAEWTDVSPVFVRAISLTWSGVDLFFVLSGYLIGGILIDQRETGNYYRAFYWRRAFRILPLYLVILGLVYFIGSAPLWPYLTFTQNIVSASSGDWNMPPSIAVTWSLAVEEQFYLVLPLLIRLFPVRLVPCVCLTLAVAAIACRAAAIFAFGNHHAAFVLLPCRMDALFLGVFAAWLVRNRPTIRLASSRRALTAAVIALGAGAEMISALGPKYDSTAMQIAGYSYLACFYFAAILLIVTGRESTGRLMSLLAKIGITAYPLYLFHFPILLGSVYFLGGGRLAVAASVIALGATTAALFRPVEQWCIDLARHRFRYEPPRSTRLADLST